MKNLDEKRAREIADRLEEIRRETNSCSVHNTKPLSKERLLELYSEENELIEEYIYGEDGLDLSESSTYYMCGDAVSIKQEEYKP